MTVFVAKYCDKHVYKWTPVEKNNDKKKAPLVWNMYEMAPLGAPMLFNNFLDNSRDLPPMCGSMQQSNSLFLQKKKKTVTVCPSPVPICNIYTRAAGLSDTSVPRLKWYLCTENHVTVVRWETGICERRVKVRGGRGRTECLTGLWKMEGKGLKKIQHASFSHSLSLQPQTLGWPGTPDPVSKVCPISVTAAL